MKTIRYAILLMVFVLAMAVFSDVAHAKSKAKDSAAPTAKSTIPDNKRPWKGIPWVIGGVLSAGVIAVGFKNAKRTHLD